MRSLKTKNVANQNNEPNERRRRVLTTRGSSAASNGGSDDSTGRGQAAPPPRNVRVGSIDEADEEHECPLCNRVFATKIGLGVHKRKSHPVVVNDEIITERVKARWSEEEVAIMAAKEAELYHVGILQPNAQLTEYMPNRTQEAIKGKRRQAAYKNLVSELIAAQAVRGERNAPIEEDVYRNDGVEGVIEEAPAVVIRQIVDLRTHIANLVQALRRSRCLAQNSLLSIAEKALAGDDVDQDIEQWLRSTFPNARSPKGPKLGNARPYIGDRYQRRLARYARLQSTQ